MIRSGHGRRENVLRQHVEGVLSTIDQCFDMP